MPANQPTADRSATVSTTASIVEAADDIALVNLSCAVGLVGSERIDIASALGQLDAWTDAVRAKTDRSWPLFDKAPADYEDSEAYFRMLVLVTVLQRDLGVGYATDTLDDEYDCTDSRLFFLHSILEGRGGTCATMPVLYAAIGRRLGYPLRIVRGKEHLFVRWNDSLSGDRFNIEATSRGLQVRTDEHYLTWPEPVNPEQVRRGWLLSDYSPREELAEFVSFRAQCLADWACYRDATRCAYDACQLTGGPDASRFVGLWSLMSALCQLSGDAAPLVGMENKDAPPLSPFASSRLTHAAQEVARLGRLHQDRRERGQAHLPSEKIEILAAACRYT